MSSGPMCTRPPARMIDAMSRTSLLHALDRPGEPTHAGPVLAAAGLVKRYGATTALGGVSIELHPRTSTAVMGPSGSGKSTLLHCIAGFTRPDEGDVSLDGHPISRLGERASSRLRRERFGFVFQSDQLLPELPAVENVALPLMLGGISRRRATAAAAEWFAPLGLDGMEDRQQAQRGDHDDTSPASSAPDRTSVWSTRPSRMCTMRSAVAATSGSWVTTSSAAPASRHASVSTVIVAAPVARSSAAVGSSANTTDGRTTSARAIATRCSCPPES